MEFIQALIITEDALGILESKLDCPIQQNLVEGSSRDLLYTLTFRRKSPIIEEGVVINEHKKKRQAELELGQSRLKPESDFTLILGIFCLIELTGWYCCS